MDGPACFLCMNSEADVRATYPADRGYSQDVRPVGENGKAKRYPGQERIRKDNADEL